jgi:CubicO group peptidase (beta-lactamase class C family)
MTFSNSSDYISDESIASAERVVNSSRPNSLAVYSPQMESLEEEVDRVAAETGFSGAVRVDRGGDVELAKAYGFAHRGLEVPNTIDTQFGTASAVKGFTASVVVGLIADGVLDLSTTARSVLGSDLVVAPFGHRRLHRRGLGLCDHRLRDADLSAPVGVAGALPRGPRRLPDQVPTG